MDAATTAAYTWDTFQRDLLAVYGDPDRRLKAAFSIRQLKQKTSAAVYASEFSALAALVGWNDDALRDQFYSGLKTDVQVEVARGMFPADLNSLAALAIQIDSWLFEGKKMSTPSNNPFRQRQQHFQAPLEPHEIPTLWIWTPSAPLGQNSPTSSATSYEKKESVSTAGKKGTCRVTAQRSTKNPKGQPPRPEIHFVPPTASPPPPDSIPILGCQTPPTSPPPALTPTPGCQTPLTWPTTPQPPSPRVFNRS